MHKNIDSCWKNEEELEKEIEEVREKLKLAALDGDISENADLMLLHEKLLSLSRKKYYLSLAKQENKRRGKFNLLVGYRIVETGEEREIMLTDKWSPDPEQNEISIDSPLGQALFEKKIDEISEVKTKTKPYKVQIINIKQKK